MYRELTEIEKSKPYSKFYYQPLTPPPASSIEEMDKGPIDPALAIPISEKDRLLIPGYTEGEYGYCVMPDGTGYVAALIDMPGVTKDMIEWFFAWFGLEDLRYMIWDPECHHAVELAKKEYIGQRCDYSLSALERRWGTEIIATEDIGGGSVPLTIKFLTPGQFGHDVDKCFEAPNVTINNINLYNGDTPMAASSHLYRATDRGVELRARFWLGWVLDDGKDVLVNDKVPPPLPKGLAYHCLVEYSNLAAILPQLYEENHNAQDKAEDFL